jgi:hypothetical protein
MSKTSMTQLAKYWPVLLLFSIHAAGQQIPVVKINHLGYVVAPGDLKAITESDFIREKLTAVEIKTVSAEGQSSATVTYLFGPSSYLEFFDNTRDETSLGVSSIAFSVDKIGDLKILKNNFDKTGKTMAFSRERDVNGAKIPWFDAVFTIDPAFAAQSRLSFWFMEYKAEYFRYNHYIITDERLTRENYLAKYEPERKDKILKEFSGLTMKLTSLEKKYLTDLFGKLGYKKISEDQFLLPDDFRFLLKERLPGDPQTIESIEFETSRNFSDKETIEISANVLIVMEGHKGQIIFK